MNMSISKEEVEQWLIATTGNDEMAVRSATAALESAESIEGFPFVLLAICSGALEAGGKVAASAYLKNLVKSHWQQSGFLSANDRLVFRNQLVDALLQADLAVLKILAEAFRLIIDNDFVRKNTWPELIPAMKTAVQRSNLVDRAGACQLKTLHVLVAIQAMIKPFQYFLNPTMAREPVPEQLEMISAQLLVPLLHLFHLLVEEVQSTKEMCASRNDSVLLVLCKSFYLAIRSHMPASLQPYLGIWCNDLFTLLETLRFEYKMEEMEHLPRLKVWKRALQICCTLVTRHRKYVDRILPNLTEMLLKLVAKGAIMKDGHPLQERVVSLAFDSISNILETGPGWRLIASHFSSLLEGAIFPALRLREKDIIDWKDDQEEYVRNNLPSEMDDASGWRDDLYTPRRSALNLLGLISTSKGPPTSAVAVNNAATKRKKAGKGGKSKETHSTAGELLVFPFLSQFPLPPDGAVITSDLILNYYAVLLAYGGMQQFLKKQKTERLCILLQNRVFPLYSMTSPCPFLLANANWLLGELASCLPEEFGKQIYDSLLKAFLAPDVGDLSWRPVRTSAAAALSVLLQEDVKPTDWLPLLQATVAVARAEDDEASTSLQLLATIAEAGEEHILPHIPDIVTAVKCEVSRRIPDIPEPWPQVVEAGFSALSSLAQVWDCDEPREDEDDHKDLPNWKRGCIVIASTFSELLQQAWIVSLKDETTAELSPPSSCLSDSSVLLTALLKYASEACLVTQWKVEQLLQVWSDLIADWSAWEEEEDLTVFEAIHEAISLQEKFPLPHFAVAASPLPPALPVQPRSILEGITAFISSAIESAYAAATWRACRLSHALLHVSANSFESDEITPMLVMRFTEACAGRLMQLSSPNVPLAKPLVLLIGMCYVCSSDSALKVLRKTGSKDGDSMSETWIKALSDLAMSKEDPMLSLESELKLTVGTLLKVLDGLICGYLAENDERSDITYKCFKSLLAASTNLQEVQDAELHNRDEEDGNDTDEDNDDDDDEDDDNDEDDDDEFEDDGKHEGTEEQFLERYAQKAQELEKDVLDEAEGGQEEDGQELELGVLGLTDQRISVYSFLQTYGRRLASEYSLPHELLSSFLEVFPDSRPFFS